MNKTRFFNKLMNVVYFILLIFPFISYIGYTCFTFRFTNLDTQSVLSYVSLLNQIGQDFTTFLSEPLDKLQTMLNISSGFFGTFLVMYVQWFIIVNMFWLVVELLTFIIDVARKFIEKAKNL